MKDILKLLFALTLISSAAGLLLAFTHKVTAAPITAAGKQESNRALATVLPPFDNNPGETRAVFVDHGCSWTFHVARKEGRYVGTAFVSSSKKGYGGEIRVMVGITADGHIKAIHILSQNETPGLGTKISDPPFKSQLEGKSIAGTVWAIKKDSGTFNAITGATISSRAVLDAIRDGVAVYTNHVTEIARTGE